MIPEFAILGHPNEGKSSVLATLAEDDSVKISSTPGETTKCRTFPVCIDGKEIIKFTDTPGFQNPGRMLHHLKKDKDQPDKLLERFHKTFQHDNDMRHDCELLLPLLRGAGIIYVADGSRPIRNVDLAEMEILRLTGKPRMAILNCKEEDEVNLKNWKTEFRKHFNSSRMFNAHSATYSERIRLLEALKSIEQDWHEQLDIVVSSFKKDWESRNKRVTDIICEMLTSCMQFYLKSSVRKESAIGSEKEKLFKRYSAAIKDLEKSSHLRIRKLYKHNIFNYQLPPQSIYHQDLFAKKTWEILGLTKKQLAIAGGLGGAALAAGIDIAAGGASLGFFTTVGGAMGALGAVYGSKNIASKINVLGLTADTHQLQIGPNENSQFPYILLDRVLIYYSHIVNWTHGRRDYSATPSVKSNGITSTLPASSIKVFVKYFDCVQKEPAKAEKCEEAFKNIILEILGTLSNGGTHGKDSLN